MKKIHLLIVLLFPLLGFAESYQLTWRAPQKWNMENDDQKVPTFDGAFYPDATGLPWWNLSVAEIVGLEVINPVYEACTTEETFFLKQRVEHIPETLLFKVRTVTERKVSSTLLSLLPFVATDGGFKKLKSFEVKHTNTIQKSAAALPADRYVAHSVLRNGTWQKIKVNKTGIYKITYEELASIGMASENIKVYGYGGNMIDEDFRKPYIDDLPEVPIYMEKGADNVFNEGDFILFYGKGPTAWSYQYGRFRHRQNVYSNAGYYFLTTDGGAGKRVVPESDPLTSSNGDITSFTDYFVHERDLVNLINSGREFYGEEFGAKSYYEFTAPFPNMLSETAYVVLDVATRFWNYYSTFRLYANDVEICTATLPPLEGSAIHEFAKTSNSVAYFTSPVGNQLNLNLTFNQPTARGWLNYFELNVKRALKMVGEAPLFFRNIDYLAQRKTHRYLLSNANATTQVWNITNPFNIIQMYTEWVEQDLAFVASTDTLNEFVAVNPSYGQFFVPEFVGAVANQDLHALPQTDMIIISNVDFMGEAQRLAEYHRQADGMSVVVVDGSIIFNEFSSGTPDASAYRRFVKMFYDRAVSPSDMPRYLLLFGDGSFDNRGILYAEKPIRRLLTFQSVNSVFETSSFVVDDYFGFLDDSEGIDLAYDRLDIGVGRFPVYSLEQAKAVVDKTIGYCENKILGNWKNQAVFVADDGDDNMHMKDADSVANLMARLYPEILVRKLYLDAYQQEVSASGERYPLAKEIFQNYIKFGTLMLNFMGHGGYNGWTNEQLLTAEDMLNMYNDRFSLWITATCDFARFDDFKDTGGEQVLRNSHGGTYGLFTTTRTVHAAPNYYLNREFINFLLKKDANGEQWSVGDVMRLAKNARNGESNKLAFSLLGDPAVKLVSPRPYKVLTDSINFHPLSGVLDTLKALDEVYLAGHIKNADSQIVEDFNGFVHISIFDKEETITTIDNDQPDPEKKRPYTYFDRPNPIFQGKAHVVNGEFNFKFLLPKDIRYNFGTGRIVYYAADETTGSEANGNFTNFVVGGENPNFEFDDVGPEITAYLNTPEFRQGGKVNETPLFVAQLYDKSGINTIGTGIGHDMILKLDNDPLKEWSLNYYYESTNGSYQQGEVRYKLTEIPEGKHTLTFRAWDLQNNSSSISLNFEVVKGLQPCLYDMYAYPNPAVSQVRFVYEHDRPDAPLDIQATVYDLSGRAIWKSDKILITNANKSEVEWDLWSSGDGVVCPGIYLVRMEVSVSHSEKISKTIKLMIKGQ